MLESKDDWQSEIPNQAYLFFPNKDDLYKDLPASNSLITYRYIFEGSTSLHPHEIEKIQKTHSELQLSENDQLWTSGYSMRFLQNKGKNTKEDAQTMLQHTEWRKANWPKKLTQEIQSQLEKGVIYIAGRDNCFRPFIVVKAALINGLKLTVETQTDVIVYLLQYTIDNLLLPGQVEGWNIIFDLKGLGTFSLPWKILKKVINCLQSNFRGRLFKSIQLNAPFSINAAWNIGKVFLEESTKEKIVITGKNCDPEILKIANKEQIEVQYGGTAENVERYWPYVPFDESTIALDNDLRICSQRVYEKKKDGHLLDQHKIMPAQFLTGSTF